MEKWIDIKDYEGLYKISTYGRVVSLPRKEWMEHKHCFRVRNGRELCFGANKWGYKMVMLYKNGKQKNYPLHRLIAIAFIPNPSNLRCVNHINGIKTDNRIENLEWCTYKSNALHSVHVLGNNAHLFSINRKTKPVIATFPDGTEKIFSGVTNAAKELGIHKSNIKNIVSGRNTKTMGGITFKFFQ